MKKETVTLYNKLEKLDLLYMFDVNLKPQAAKMFLLAAGFYLAISFPAVFFSWEIFVGVLIFSVLLAFISLIIYVTENPRRAKKRKQKLYVEAYQGRYGSIEPRLLIPQA